ncbi:MAG: thiamine phosphate synthase [Clostridia bacterium]|nr:thiamine phosphate synthase [Clostridia bacterium]
MRRRSGAARSRWRQWHWDVYVITDAHLVPGRDHVALARAAVAGGASAIQLRDKTARVADLCAWARAMADVCRSAGVPFIVNDRTDVALATDADGVHVGQDDLPVALARKILGPSRLLGVSVDNPEEARRAAAAGADYVGAGSVFATATKPDAGPVIGLEGLRAICEAVGIPVIAIGGITAANAAACIAAGAAGVAVVSAVVAAPDVEAATRELAQTVRRAKAERACGP